MSNSEVPTESATHAGRVGNGEVGIDIAIDFGSLAEPFTPMDEQQAAAVASELYNLTGRMTRFATEKDDTFRIQAPDGRAYVLKIANPGESRDEIALQVDTLLHIADRDPGLPVPRVFSDRNGRNISATMDASGVERCVRLMSFLPGTVLDTVASEPGEREQVGRILARLRLAMADFVHPAANRVLAWDVRHLPSLTVLLEHVGDSRQRRMLEEGLARFRSLMPEIDALPRQILHNDFSRSNIVIDRNLPDYVTGIIDFGDVVETAVAIDVSTAMLNQLPRDADRHPVEDMLGDARDILRGYRALAPLSVPELAMIPHLVMGRVVTRALLTLWRARLFPDNSTYILRNTEQGWAQLDWFLARGTDEVSALLL